MLTILLAPFVWGAYELYKEVVPGQVVSLLEVFPLTIFFSVVLSIPTLFTAYLIITALGKTDLDFRSKKVIVYLISLIGTWGTLKIIDGSLIPTLMLNYIAALTFGAIILEIASRIKNEKTTYNKVS